MAQLKQGIKTAQHGCKKLKSDIHRIISLPARIHISASVNVFSFLDFVSSNSQHLKTIKKLGLNKSSSFSALIFWTQCITTVCLSMIYCLIIFLHRW